MTFTHLFNLRTNTPYFSQSYMMHLDTKLLNKKLNNIFSKDRQRDKPPETQKYFDQTYFDCKLVYAPLKLSLIKINASIAVGLDAGTPMMTNCRWFVQKDDQYTEIDSIRSPYYQPCIDDVGCSIHVEIEPMIEGKVYTGAKIIKQTAPLELGLSLETQFMQLKNNLYHLQRPIEFMVKIQSANLNEALPPGIEFPQHGCLLISKQNGFNFDIKITIGDTVNNWMTYYWFTNAYPVVQNIRKSYNSIILRLNDNQCMRIVFTEHGESGVNNREILGLLVKTLVANSNIQENAHIDPETSDTIIAEQNGSSKHVTAQHSVTDPQSHNLQKSTPSSEQPQHCLSSTDTSPNPQFQSMQLLQSENKSLKSYIHKQQSQLQQLQHELSHAIKNRNMDKQVRINLQKKTNQLTQKLQEIQSLNKHILGLKQKLKAECDNNRFYRNQIGFLKKQLKDSHQMIRSATQQRQALQNKLNCIEKQALENENARQSSNTAKLHQYKDTLAQFQLQREESTQEKQRLRGQIEKLQNQLKTAHCKIDSITMQKSIDSPVKLQSVFRSDFEHLAAGFSPQKMGASAQVLASKEKEITNLQFKVANLEMLLKYKNSTNDHGNEVIHMHKVINSLTEAVTEKEQEMGQIKKVNKELMKRVMELNKCIKTINKQ